LFRLWGHTGPARSDLQVPTFAHHISVDPSQLLAGQIDLGGANVGSAAKRKVRTTLPTW
jgi:hypothetical protein